MNRTINISLPWLTIVFIILKLTGVIAWSWWWVFSPLWIPYAVMSLVLIFWFLIFVALVILSLVA